MPCLNEGDHISDFLSSLVLQDHSAFELIVIDGGSSDNSRALIDGFRDRLNITGLIDETRNLGYVRNRGARCARGKLLLFTNSDALLPQGFLAKVCQPFEALDVAALSGRTIPLEGGIICSAAYSAFDLLRWGFSKIGRFSPSGNFLAIRAPIFWDVGGFPELRLNEDGALGIKLSHYARERRVKLKFDMALAAGHYSERFKRGPLKTLMFYSYVFGNFSPFLKRILNHVEQRSSREFGK